MLIFDRRTIGNRLLTMRKKRGLTQAEVAELAGLSLYQAAAQTLRKERYG